MCRSGQTIKQTLSDPAQLAQIREAVRDATKSRTALAAELCETLEFHDALGNPRVGSCLRALRDLEDRGEFKLPARQQEPCSWSPRRLQDPVPEPVDVPVRVDAVLGLRLELIDPENDKGMRTWNELMLREHPWGEGRLVGQQLRYLVRSKHGVLGAVGFAASALSLEDRERWIGWDATQRTTHLNRVLNLSRLLIRPSVRCKNLASKVLGICAQRVQLDFAGRYGFEPWILETFVEEQQHDGACFRAANWQRIGQTKGRGRNDREGDRQRSPKGIFVYPLVPDFRERIGVDPERGMYLRPLAIEQGLAKHEWAKLEFGSVELGDKRLRDRLIQIVEDRAQRPNTSYLEACEGDRAALKGFYRFVDSDRDSVTPEAILSEHRERTIGRMMSHKFVLAVQDTTDLNFASRPNTEGLGLIGTNQTGAKSNGLKLHTTLTLSEEGLPLGVLRSVAYSPEETGKQPPNRPIEEKKSFKWIEAYRDCLAIAQRIPDTRILSVMDREADISELFFEARSARNRVGLLVRASSNRSLDGCDQKLFERLRTLPETFEIEASVPRQRSKKAKSGKPGQEGRKARSAILTVGFEKISIRPTRSDLRSQGPVTLWAVRAAENQPPEGAARIEWMLLTTEAVESIDDAARIVSLYQMRWRIEEWHRVLKSGCKVMEHQHQTAERLKRVIAMDAVLAWRIQVATLLGREAPDLEPEVFFDEWEVRVLGAVEESKGREKPRTLSEAIIAVARLGGYLARRSDPPPGSKVLWRGFVRLDGVVDGFQLGLAMTRGP